MKLLASLITGLFVATVAQGAAAQVRIDISLPWGPTEFHTTNAQDFAKRVAEATAGRVQMTVHAGGALGIKANETVRAIEDGTAAMAEFAGFQNVGEVPMLGIESLPFLVDDYAQLRVMHSFVRPQWVETLAKRGNRVLYVVPWPSQNFFLKKPATSFADLKGTRMRTYDRVTAEMVSKLGMVPQQMNNPDIVPALASGRLDAVMTSGTTAVSQKYWQFLKHTYTTNHLWASNLMVIGDRTWQKISAADRAAIEKIATEREPEYWKVSMAEHETQMKRLLENGMTVEPPSKAMADEMRRVTRPMWDDFVTRTGPEAKKVMDAFMAATGKK
jgi:TRAP-type C4-dicarboxylate transport system substrate-binding protein